MPRARSVVFCKELSSNDVPTVVLSVFWASSRDVYHLLRFHDACLRPNERIKAQSA